MTKKQKEELAILCFLQELHDREIEEEEEEDRYLFVEHEQ